LFRIPKAIIENDEIYLLVISSYKNLSKVVKNVIAFGVEYSLKDGKYFIFNFKFGLTLPEANPYTISALLFKVTFARDAFFRT
jgi:hypothetical protein